MTETARWLELSEADIANVDAIARTIHRDLAERPEILAEKLRLFPDGCRKLMVDGVMRGYALAHPWRLFAPPALDPRLDAIPADADCLHIHDVALLPRGRGRGALAAFVAHVRALAAARRLRKIACVSVYGTDVIWTRYGFGRSDEPSSPTMLAYGPTARYMIADARAAAGAVDG